MWLYVGARTKKKNTIMSSLFNVKRVSMINRFKGPELENIIGVIKVAYHF